MDNKQNNWDCMPTSLCLRHSFHIHWEQFLRLIIHFFPHVISGHSDSHSANHPSSCHLALQTNAIIGGVVLLTVLTESFLFLLSSPEALFSIWCVCLVTNKVCCLFFWNLGSQQKDSVGQFHFVQENSAPNDSLVMYPFSESKLEAVHLRFP